MNKIINSNKEEIKDLCQQFHVKSLEVFGSATNNNFNKESDIDFLVEFTQLGVKNYADNYFGLLHALKALFKQPIDLVVNSSINNPYFLESIQKDRAFLYAA
jgi:predicted nucleotidyltransferase